MDARAGLKESLTAEAGQSALRSHVVEKARLARARHGPRIDEGAMLRILLDPAVVRFPTTVAFDDAPLMPGEFACPIPRTERPSDGFVLVVHPTFRNRSEVLPLLLAYHVVAINYLDVATHEEAELFGATLLDMDVDEFYRRVCALADELAAPPVRTPFG